MYILPNKQKASNEHSWSWHAFDIYFQVNKKHSDGAPAMGQTACVIDLSISGTSFKATGSVQGEIPVLVELAGSRFWQPVPLSGNLLFLKAASTPLLLSEIAGERVPPSSLPAPSHVTSNDRAARYKGQLGHSFPGLFCSGERQTKRGLPK